MPSLRFHPRDEDSSNNQPSSALGDNQPQADTSPQTIGIIVVSVVGTLACVMVVVALVFGHYRRRKGEREGTRDSPRTIKRYSWGSTVSIESTASETRDEDRRRRSSTGRKSLTSRLSWLSQSSSSVDQTEQEERQRTIMIQKSLANRYSQASPLASESHLPAPRGPAEDEDEEEDEKDQAGTLLADWKQWEARVQTERVRSSETHPLAAVPGITVPPKSREPSLSHSVLLRQHPAFASP